MWKLALHSVSYAGVWAKHVLTLEEFIDHASALGYDGVMLMAKRPHASILDMNAQRIARLRDQLSSKNVAVASIAAYTDFTAGAERPDIPLGETQLAYVRACAQLAKDLDCEAVRIFTGYERADTMPAVGWQKCVAAIKECGRLAADYGVRIIVQNHHDIANHHVALASLLDEVDEPNVMAGYDAWAPALHGLTGAQLAESVRYMKPYTAQTIVADYVLVQRYRYERELNSYESLAHATFAVPMGEGFIDYKSFFTALTETGYTGWVIYEMCSPIRGGGSAQNLDLCARKFVEWMHNRGK